MSKSSPDYHYQGTSHKVDSGHMSRLANLHFAIAEHATVKDTDFDHGFTSLWNQKRPPLSRRADEWIAVRMVQDAGGTSACIPLPDIQAVS